MAGARRAMINGGNFSERFNLNSSRPLPKRGQVKVAIVVGLAHSFAAIFSLNTSHRAAAASTAQCSQLSTRTYS